MTRAMCSRSDSCSPSPSCGTSSAMPHLPTRAAPRPAGPPHELRACRLPATTTPRSSTTSPTPVTRFAPRCDPERVAHVTWQRRSQHGPRIDHVDQAGWQAPQTRPEGHHVRTDSRRRDHRPGAATSTSGSPAVRAAAIFGLTDDQARMRPCRGRLSIGGLIKHATYGMRGATERLTGDGSVRSGAIDEDTFAAYGVELRPDRPGDRGRRDRRLRRGPCRPTSPPWLLTDPPGLMSVEPPAPWHDTSTTPGPADARYYLVHQIEEFARHAGHADISGSRSTAWRFRRSC